MFEKKLFSKKECDKRTVFLTTQLLLYTPTPILLYTKVIFIMLIKPKNMKLNLQIFFFSSRKFNLDKV